MRPLSTSSHCDFSYRYGVGSSAASMRVERRVLGSDCGASGYTTRGQAERVGEALDLDAASRLLDLGAGCGWPGLYLGSTTGCRVVSSDVTLEAETDDRFS